MIVKGISGIVGNDGVYAAFHEPFIESGQMNIQVAWVSKG